MTDHFTFKLGDDNRRSLNRLAQIRKRGKVTTIDVKALESFHGGGQPLVVMQDLVNALSEVSTLQNLSIKLRPLPESPASLPCQSLRTLLQGAALKSIAAINVKLHGQTTALNNLPKSSCLESVRLVSCHPESRDHPEGCLSNFLVGLANIPSLKTIVCTNNTFVCEEHLVQALLQFISTNHVENLTIKNCTNFTPLNLFRPLEALKTNTKLTSLILSTSTPMNDQGVQWIGEMLACNETLEELSVDCGNASLFPIPIALETNNRTLKSFVTLGRQANTSQAKLVAALDRMLASNCVLQHLGVPGARWSYNVDHYLRLNRAGRQFLFNTGRSRPEDWVEAIISYRRDTPILFELMSKNPAALCNLRGNESSKEESSEEESSVDESVEPVRKRGRTF